MMRSRYTYDYEEEYVQTKRRRKKKKTKKKAIFFLILVVVIAAVVAFLFLGKSSGPKSYDDAASFDKFANKYFSQVGSSQDVGTATTSVQYAVPKSTAISYPKLEATAANIIIERAVDNAKTAFNNERSNIADTDQAALLVGYESHKVSDKVVSVVIHEQHYVKLASEKTGSFPVQRVKTFNFASEYGASLGATQIFKDDYVTKISSILTDELEGKYDGLDVNKVSATSGSFSKFIMTGNSFIFYFDAGEIANADEGIITVEIPESDLKGYVRDDIGERAVDPNGKMVALTFDDGPSATTTNQILDIFEKNKSVCTFFELGQNVEAIETAGTILKRELELGCEIGTHSYSHPDLLSATEEEIAAEAKKSKEAIYNACGEYPTVFRPPYGNGSKKIAKAFNLPAINWNVDTMDWSSKNAKKVIASVKDVGNLNGSIVLMHSIYDSTVKAVETLVPYLISEGYQLVTVSELLQYHYGETPQNGKWYGYTYMSLND